MLRSKRNIMMEIALAQMAIDSRGLTWEPDPASYKEKLEKKAASFIKKAAKQGAKLVVLPELFNCPYFPASKKPLPHWKTFVSTMFMDDLILTWTRCCEAASITGEEFVRKLAHLWKELQANWIKIYDDQSHSVE